jgi:hypothetical protein
MKPTDDATDSNILPVSVSDGPTHAFLEEIMDAFAGLDAVFNPAHRLDIHPSQLKIRVRFVCMSYLVAVSRGMVGVYQDDIRSYIHVADLATVALVCLAEEFEQK